MLQGIVRDSGVKKETSGETEKKNKEKGKRKKVVIREHATRNARMNERDAEFSVYFRSK